MLNSLPALLVDSIWQTTLILAIGLLTSLLWSRWPARAHRVLLLTIVMCLVAPLLSQTVRNFGWGLIPQSSSIPILSQSTSSLENLLSAPPVPSEPATLPKNENSSAASVPLQPSARIATPSVPADSLSSTDNSSFSWRLTLLVLWLALSGFVAMRHLISMAKGISTLKRSRMSMCHS